LLIFEKQSKMTSKQISDQIETIRSATEKASASPEAALAFLRAAGIIKPASTSEKAAQAELSYPAARKSK